MTRAARILLTDRTSEVSDPATAARVLSSARSVSLSPGPSLQRFTGGSGDRPVFRHPLSLHWTDLLFPLITLGLLGQAHALMVKKSLTQATTEEGAAPVLSLQSPSGLLVSAGFVLEPGKTPVILQPLNDSVAGELGLKSQDRLLFLNGRKTASHEELEWALRSWNLKTRLSAVVARQLSVTDLSTAWPNLEKIPSRSPSLLTPHEQGLQQQFLKEAEQRAPQIWDTLRGLSFQVSAGERIWIRFPKGIPKMLEQGDILEGETNSVLTTDPNLDFLAIPQGSPVWAQVLSVSDSGESRLLRLHIYKIRLREGHTYRCSAILEGISGRQDLVRIAPGGTIVSALQQEGLSLLEPERSFRIRFLEPWTIHEPERFFKTGAGLWFKSSGDQDKIRFFEITHILPNRSADRAGLKVGDRLRSIDGADAGKFSFAEAIQRSYGPPGSILQVEVLREDGRGEKIRLKRGVLYRKNLGLRYRWEGDSAVIAKVFADSPAGSAGLKEGDKLLQIGGRSLREMHEGQLRQFFQGDLAGDNALTYERPGYPSKSIELKQNWVPFPIPLRPENQPAAESQTP